MKKRIILIVSSVAAVAIFITVFMVNSLPVGSDCLSREEIAVLREEYPLHSGVPTVGSMLPPPSLGWIMERSDNLLYAKVLGRINPYSMEVEDIGAKWQIDFFGYSLQIISDGAGTLKEGEKVTVSANMLTEELFPALAEGMEIIVPIAMKPNGGEAYDFVAYGMYYVTKEGYALSAYDMEEAVAKDGMRVDALLKDLWQMKTS